MSKKGPREIEGYFDFDWAASEATAKKKLDFSAVELPRVNESLCVQCMYTGSYDDGPTTIARAVQSSGAHLRGPITHCLLGFETLKKFEF